jgi:hypothetical protein
LELVVVVGALEATRMPEVLASLEPAGWVVELLPLGRGLAQTLLAVRGSSRREADLGYERTQAWVRQGVFELQQWRSTDPPELLVTCARKR